MGKSRRSLYLKSGALLSCRPGHGFFIDQNSRKLGYTGSNQTRKNRELFMKGVASQFCLYILFRTNLHFCPQSDIAMGNPPFSRTYQCISLLNFCMSYLDSLDLSGNPAEKSSQIKIIKSEVKKNQPWIRNPSLE